MLLGASGETVDLHAVTEGEGVTSGLPGGEGLTALAESTVRGDEEGMRAARVRVRGELGEAALVDAAAVIGNFERMVRIADGSGIPLDEPVAMVSADLRDELGLDAFGGAERVGPVQGVRRLAGRVLGRMLPAALKVLRPR